MTPEMPITHKEHVPQRLKPDREPNWYDRCTAPRLWTNEPQEGV